MRRAPASCQRETIGVETDSCVEIPITPPAQRLVKYEAVNQICSGSDTGCNEIHAIAKSPSTLSECADADIATAAPMDALRDCGNESQPFRLHNLCRTPPAVLAGNSTPRRSAAKQGRRQEPCTTHYYFGITAPHACRRRSSDNAIADRTTKHPLSRPENIPLAKRKGHVGGQC